MMIRLKEIRDSFFHLLFPHICCGCGTDIIDESSMLCLRCLNALPVTGYEKFPDNPVERIFWGRIPVKCATAQFYFTKESLMQALMHQLKYRGNKDLGFQLGRLMGLQLLGSNRFSPDAMIPLPLFPGRERKRGYNQAAVLCEGISEITRIPVLKDVIRRVHPTATQTRKSRIERWLNMEGRFELFKPERIKARHILLVDDVITTGASLEACGKELLQSNDTELSIATLCYAARI
jgi:ComF family protein